ncbi:MAG TPA: GntR family transcriptional regulator [Burkholderiaceae bacterium]|nr:GntR family transcriptional regulator [Burkholderiaceae bacterium]
MKPASRTPSTSRRRTGRRSDEPVKARSTVKAGSVETRSIETRSLEADPPIDERIYRAVFDAVMSQRLVPGTRLPESSLCALFGAGRSTVRTVLQRLAHDRIVELKPNRGASVAAPGVEETRRVFEARRAIEAAVVRLVSARPGGLTAAERADLKARLEQEHAAMHRFDQVAWARLASSFHLRLGELAGNPILLRYLTELVSRCSLVVALYERPGNAACEHAEHARIVDLIAAGQADRAVAEMEAHLRRLESNLDVAAAEAAPSLARMLGLAPVTP